MRRPIETAPDSARVNSPISRLGAARYALSVVVGSGRGASPERIQTRGRLMGMKYLQGLGVAAALAISACSNPAGTLAPADPPNISAPIQPTSSTTTSTPELPASLAEYLHGEIESKWGLIPESSVEGDRSVIDVTFTDGRQVEIVYPTPWPLDQYGWTPDTNIVYEFDEPREDGSSVIHAQLIFGLGPDGEWRMGIHPMSVWSDEELAFAESLVALDEEPNGFVTVRTIRPLSHYTRDPDQAPFNPDHKGGEARIYIGDILGLASTGTCVDDAEYPYPLRQTHGVTWCDNDAGVTISFLVPEEYHDEILDHLDVRLVTAGPGG